MRSFRINRRSAILTLLAVGSLSLAAPAAGGGLPTGTDADSGRTALLSLANRTEEPSAAETIQTLVRKEFETRGVHCVPDSVLRSALRKHRIRTADAGVGIDQAREIEEDTGAKVLVLGSVDIWRADEDPEVGISLRIVRVRDMRIVGASSVSARGKDFERLFGFGRITGTADLAPRVVRMTIEELDRSPAPDTSEPLDGGFAGVVLHGNHPRVSLVTLDNLSAAPHGGEIVTSVLLSRMVQAGFDVLEPGVAQDVFARAQRFPCGEIDYALMHALTEATGSQFIVTGVVQDLAPATGLEGIPRFEFGARGIDGRTGRVVFTVDRKGDGRDSETILRLGRVRSLTVLVERSLDPVIEATILNLRNQMETMESREAVGVDTGMAGTGWKQK